MRTEQVNHDQLARCTVGQDLGERRQYVAIVLAGVLVTVVVEVDLFVGLFGERGEHGVALGHGLLIGHPEGFIPRLFHHAHQRRRTQVEVRVLFVSKGQHLLQRFDGVGARGHHVVEYGQLVAEFVEVGCRLALITIEAHALAVG